MDDYVVFQCYKCERFFKGGDMSHADRRISRAKYIADVLAGRLYGSEACCDNCIRYIKVIKA